MLTLHILLADTVLLTANIFGYKFVLTLGGLIYLIIAALIGLLAEFIVGWRLPFGFIGAIIAALLGMWILTHIVSLTIPGDPTFYGIPLFKALIGAILFVALWHLITARAWRPRRRYA